MMKFDMTSGFSKFYLGTGTLLCMLYLVGAFNGYKIPKAKFAPSSSRGVGGSWGYGK